MDLVDVNYHLLPVINRFGITLGQKEASLEEICESKGVNLDFFLVILNTFHNKNYFPEDELKSFSPILIIDYLKKTHDYYASYVLPKLEDLLAKLIESDTSNNKELLLIRKFYLKYKNELIIHVKEEEELVFPYISSLVEKGKVNSVYSIHSFEEEHSNVEDKLNDLKSLIVKYLKPVYDNNICNEFLITLFRFEKDISNHNRIESNILIPQVQELELSKNA
jgi:regulator of cell morphogenesis and NO signaling